MGCMATVKMDKNREILLSNSCAVKTCMNFQKRIQIEYQSDSDDDVEWEIPLLLFRLD